MDPNDINVNDFKQKKWNPFQKVKNRSVPNLAQLVTTVESKEFERVSYATSIKKLPQRPSAFTQVLKQIGASRNSKPEKMKRVHSFKRLNKDSRSNSPQPQSRLSIGSTGGASNLEVDTSTRFRTLSNSSDRVAVTTLAPDIKFPMNLTGLDDSISNNNVERSLSVDQSRPNTSNGSISAGTLLANESFVQPTVAGTSMSTNVTAENGSTSFDVVDGANAVDVQKLRQDTEHLQQKILKISEAIKVEQATRDDNVSEYLKLATNADRQQAGRIKSVFEKKNQKSNATIQQLQKKLDTYHRRLRDLESGGGGKPWKVRGNLRDFSGGVVESVKGGLSGLQQVTQNAAGAIAAKPKDLASKIKSRFGSADNLHTLSNFDETLSDDFAVSNRYGSADDVSSTSGSTTDNLVQDDGRRSITTSPNKNSIVLRRDEHSQQLQEVANQLIFVKTELQEIRQSQSKSEAAWTQWKDKYITEMNFLTNSLQDEKFRNERLEVQLNDLTELHQRETCNLKQELTSMEEKVEYHAHERARDMQEALESCETRISKMELQQQQQLMPGDALESANARVLIGKLINLLMSVLAVVLVLVSAAYNISMPLFKTQGRVVTTVCAVLAFIIAYKNWTYFISVFGVYDVDQT